jgi:hypothetical protein
VPRPMCAGCNEPMAFDGSYPRRVREAGVVHRIFVRRARCPRCGTGDALLPDFVLRNRLDSTSSVGAAVLGHAGLPLPGSATALFRHVPGRTVRSWRQRFGEKADELTTRFAAVCAEWGGTLPRGGTSTPSRRAIGAIGAVWTAAQRLSSEVPPPWLVANIIVGGQLLSNRVDLPWPVVPRLIGRSRPP